MTNRGTDATKVYLGESVCFTGVTYESMGEGSLAGAHMTQGSCITKVHASMGDSSSWEHEAQCTDHKQLNLSWSVLSKWLTLV